MGKRIVCLVTFVRKNSRPKENICITRKGTTQTMLKTVGISFLVFVNLMKIAVGLDIHLKTMNQLQKSLSATFVTKYSKQEYVL